MYISKYKTGSPSVNAATLKILRAILKLNCSAAEALFLQKRFNLYGCTDSWDLDGFGRAFKLKALMYDIRDGVQGNASTPLGFWFYAHEKDKNDKGQFIWRVAGQINTATTAQVFIVPFGCLEVEIFTFKDSAEVEEWTVGPFFQDFVFCDDAYLFEKLDIAPSAAIKQAWRSNQAFISGKGVAKSLKLAENADQDYLICRPKAKD